MPDMSKIKKKMRDSKAKLTHPDSFPVSTYISSKVVKDWGELTSRHSHDAMHSS